MAEAVKLVRLVLAIELMTAARALEFLTPLKTSPMLERLRVAVEVVCPRRKEDAPFGESIQKLEGWLKGWRVWSDAAFARS
jgi:histidine ammonia-lyase